MNNTDFNLKYKNHLKEGNYGLDIENDIIIKFLDKEFEKETINNPDFKFTQIKLKVGTCRLYSNSPKSFIWEKEVDYILKHNRNLTESLKIALEWWKNLPVEDLENCKNGWANYTMKYYPKYNNCYSLTEEEIFHIYK